MQGSTGTGLDAIERRELADDRGVRYTEFKRGLRARYGLLWVELLMGHVAIAATLAALIALGRAFPSAWPLLAVGGAVPIGMAIAYIHLFFHEAAHYNIAPSRRMNDVLANLFIGSIVGEDIRAYRPIHFDHHRFLGTTQDTERTYFDCLDWRFIVESLTGIKVVRVLFFRGQKLEKKATDGATKKKSLFNVQLLLALAIHGSLLALFVTLHAWGALVAWLAGMGTVFPFFVTLRQLLEHRSFEAQDDVDYRTTPHGAVNRLFGTSLLARVLGGAGFNRHILHHWEPQISYTCFGELETYLARTSAGEVIALQRISYPGAFKRLFRGRRAAPATVSTP